MAGKPKFPFLNAEIEELLKQNPLIQNKEIAEQLIEKYPEHNLSFNTLRQKASYIRKGDIHLALSAECKEIGIPVESVNHYWYKGKNFSIHCKNGETSYEEFRKGLIEDLKEYAPNFEKIKRTASKDGHLLVLDLADIHFGKLCKAYETGEDYNIEVTRMRTIRGVEGVLEKVSGFEIEQIMLVIGNDMLHVDNTSRTTTGGTKQDTDGNWYEAFLKAKETIVDCIEILLPIADIHLHYDPSNHDYMSGFMLADSIYSWFRNNENMTFNFSPSHRKYYKWNKSLIGTTHGDGAKWKDLPNLMAMEAKEEWSNTDHKYFYTHHIHHKQAQDFIGVTCESLRSISSADSWHHQKGFQHSPKAIEAFIHSKENGQIARISHIFN